VPVPKRKVIRMNRDSRRSQIKLRARNETKCPDCGAPKMAHVVCDECGKYKGTQVISEKS